MNGTCVTSANGHTLQKLRQHLLVLGAGPGQHLQVLHDAAKRLVLLRVRVVLPQGGHRFSELLPLHDQPSGLAVAQRQTNAAVVTNGAKAAVTLKRNNQLVERRICVVVAFPPQIQHQFFF